MMRARKRITEACRLNGEWLSDFYWCKGFKPEDFVGKHVLVRTKNGPEIRGMLTCHGMTEHYDDPDLNGYEHSGYINIESEGIPALHGGVIMGQATDLAVMRLMRQWPSFEPAEESAREGLWETIADIDDIAFVWDEQDYAPTPARWVKVGEMAILGTRLYPITSIDGDWITVDAGKPVTVRKDMAAGFLGTDLAD